MKKGAVAVISTALHHHFRLKSLYDYPIVAS